ncbi:MAG: hypothetical protein M1814_002703 [Vezdaea aestivalis]|nr:MAG: hypothetical protein M1814_002703 [Vezdaea aestivalis]
MSEASRLAIASFARYRRFRPGVQPCSKLQKLAVLPRSYSTSSDSPSPTKSSSSTLAPSTSRQDEEGRENSEEEEITEETAKAVTATQRSSDHHYGSVHRRILRNRKGRESPNTIPIANFFITKNVHLSGELSGRVQALKTLDKGSDTSTTDSQNRNSSDPISTTRYPINNHIWNEIISTIRGGLQLSANSTPINDNFAAVKSHILLQCPKNGGAFFLDSLVERCALEAGTDLVTIDAQDIAEIAGDWLGDGSHPGPHSISSLGFDTHRVAFGHELNRDVSVPAEDIWGEDHDEIMAELQNTPNRPRQSNLLPKLVPASEIFSISTVSSALGNMQRTGKGPGEGENTMGSFYTSGPGDSTSMMTTQELPKALSTRNIETLLQALIGAPSAKRAIQQTAPSPSGHVSSISQKSKIKPLILHVQDFKELTTTFHGGIIVRALFKRVAELRRDGQKVLLVGSTSAAHLVPSLSREGVQMIQSELSDWPLRTIVVTPERGDKVDEVFRTDRASRVRQINLRHLDFMIRRKALVPEAAESFGSNEQVDHEVSKDLVSGTSDSVWSFDKVHRLAQAVVGSEQANPTAPAVGKALDTLNASDEVKSQWMKAEKEQMMQKELASDDSQTMQLKPGSAEQLLRIRPQCDEYEKKLLSGIINPKDIKTTFRDVNAPAETVEALRSSISLSLSRPDAFSYGVLKTERLNGLLLYGPPGTGKTLLAKAVAKESGAVMLEVSGAEIYDMYVGEGEKNTKAVFSLAEKLAPCVIFLDEADALLGTRSRSSSRSTHRELMNQFLKEMDGVTNDKPAFVMVATNRPFDLDDAVLRRLPRRVLVDLPSEKDREDIMRLHLQKEVLDESILLSDIAKRTPFYSGSDLKNVAVAAAIACVKEENAEAAKSGSEPHVFPEKRTLCQRHFDQALEEISASISDDMSSLVAIRKFDEKYGDRKGRRKKKPVLGFGSVPDGQKRGETGKVRN